MVTYAHERLLISLEAADKMPDGPSEMAAWLRGTDHLKLLRTDAGDTEIILTAFSSGTCMNSFVVPKDLPGLQGDLLALYDWSPNPYHHDGSSYSWIWDLGTGDVHADEGGGGGRGGLPPSVSPLVFFRTIEGVDDDTRVSREIAQDFIHASATFWRSERRSYSRLNFRGDWEDVVSCSVGETPSHIDLVSAHRQSIDLHLTALEAVLVRVFEFHLQSKDLPPLFHFTDEDRRFKTVEDNLHHRGVISDKGIGIICGVQIIHPTLSSTEVEHLVKKGRIPDPQESDPVSFIVDDIRNGVVTTVSTDPSTTTDYFTTAGNSLPFETSPAYFRPDVLLKYKADRDKYTVRDTEIECRGGWGLRSYHVNDAGQISAYICDLRNLPHEEQLHWATYNERPKAGLSARAIETDFQGKWPEEMTALEKLVDVLQGWRGPDVKWWTWRDEHSPELLTVPRTESRQEWGDALVALSNSVIEGFVVKELRQILRDGGGNVDKQWRSIKLLEEILQNRGIPLPGGSLTALREVNEGRVFSDLHATGSKGAELSRAVMEKHGTFTAHFEYLCEEVAKELALVEQALSA